MKTIFPMKENPIFKDSQLIAKWANRVELFCCMDGKRFEKIKCYAMFTSCWHPFCDDVNRLENILKLWLLMIAMDDHQECDWGYAARDPGKTAHIWIKVMAISERLLDNKFIPMSDWEPYALLLFTVFENICKDLNPVSKRRLLSVYSDHALHNIVPNSFPQTTAT